MENFTTRNDALEDLGSSLETVRFAFQKVLLPLICACGTFGNILNIIVLTRRWMKSSTNHYLAVLACYDVLYLLCSITMSLKHYSSIGQNSVYLRYRKPVGKPIIDIMSNTGVWITLTFTLERYISVVHPMKGKVWCTPERARYVILAVCLASALCTLPEFFENEAQTIIAGNSTKVQVKVTALGQHPFYAYGYVYTNQVLFTFAPLVALFVLNLLLVRAVLSAAKLRNDILRTNSQKQAHARQAEQTRITGMLIAVILLFLFCYTPQALLNIYVSYLQMTFSVPLTAGQIAEGMRVRMAANACNFLVVLNASANFVLYSSFSTKFRRTFRRLFCSWVEMRRWDTVTSQFSGARSTHSMDVSPLLWKRQFGLAFNRDRPPETFGRWSCYVNCRPARNPFQEQKSARLLRVIQEKASSKRLQQSAV